MVIVNVSMTTYTNNNRFVGQMRFSVRRSFINTIVMTICFPKCKSFVISLDTLDTVLDGNANRLQVQPMFSKTGVD